MLPKLDISMWTFLMLRSSRSWNMTYNRPDEKEILDKFVLKLDFYVTWHISPAGPEIQKLHQFLEFHQRRIQGV